MVRDHDVVYVYHNLIDKTGDTRDTEERVFGAAEETLEELLRVIKKLANANASNIVVTADHGFVYQDHDFPGFKSETWRHLDGSNKKRSETCTSHWSDGLRCRRYRRP